MLLAEAQGDAVSSYEAAQASPLSIGLSSLEGMFWLLAEVWCVIVSTVFGIAVRKSNLLLKSAKCRC